MTLDQETIKLPCFSLSRGSSAPNFNCSFENEAAGLASITSSSTGEGVAIDSVMIDTFIVLDSRSRWTYKDTPRDRDFLSNQVSKRSIGSKGGGVAERSKKSMGLSLALSNATLPHNSCDDSSSLFPTYTVRTKTRPWIFTICGSSQVPISFFYYVLKDNPGSRIPKLGQLASAFVSHSVREKVGKDRQGDLYSINCYLKEVHGILTQLRQSGTTSPWIKNIYTTEIIEQRKKNWKELS